MVEKSAQPGGNEEYRLLGRLYRQAARRWLILAGALAFLVWLGIFAGKVRNPEAVKREWAVMVSRVMVVAGGVFVIRLTLFSYEERVPVLLFSVSSAKDPGRVITAIRESLSRFRAGGYEIIPLGDICEFVREHRYVPKKCMGVVIQTADMPELEAVVEALGETRLALLLPPEALVGDSRQLAETKIPAGVSLGVSFRSSAQPEDAGSLLDLLKDLGARSTGAGGHELRYVRLKETGAIELRGLLRDTPYRCFLDGKGFNRFGDEPDMLRPIDTSAIMASRRAGANLSLYVDLFKGRYYVWPVVALLRLSGAGPGAT